MYRTSKPLWTASTTVRNAVRAGNFDTARRSARAVWKGTEAAFDLPAHSNPEAWSLVADYIQATAKLVDAKNRSARVGY